MKIFETKNLMTIHLVFAAFMLPICMLFLITGVLYFIFEYDGTYFVKEHEIKLETPIIKNIEIMTQVVEPELARLGYPMPKGWTGISKLDQEPFYQLEWHHGLDRIVRLKAGEEPLVGKLSIHDANIFKKLMLLHMAYGDNIFRIYSILFSTILFLMFVSGYILALRMKNHRNLTIYSSLLSIVLFWIIFEIQ